MEQELLVRRRRVRDEVRDRIRSAIVGGVLPSATRLDEVRLSQEMGVSRTPLREALIALEEEGLVHSAPNKGFIVVPADAALVRETYPILGSLERLAVGLSGHRLLDDLPELERLNESLAGTAAPAEQYRLDQAFHDGLVRRCGNRRLLKLIDDHRLQARRFDGAHRRGTADRDGSCAEHREILAAIGARCFGDAQRLVEDHWRRGEAVVIAWLEERQ